MEAECAQIRDGYIRIAITVPYYFAGEAQLIEAKLRSGDADYVHIRKPDTSEAELAQLLSDIPHDLVGRLCLHDCFTLANGFGVGGIHLNCRNPQPPPGWGGRVSRSCHSISEVKCAKEFDYVTLSPIFPSLSKPGYKGNLTFDILKAYLSEPHTTPVVALGGVTEQNRPLIQAMGFDGDAMLGNAWRRRFTPGQFALQLITNPDSIEDAERQSREAIAGGCRWVQLRWKEAGTNALLEAGKRIASLCREAGAIFLLDDHVELVEAVDADGVHLGKNDMPVDEARRILGPSHIIGATANTPNDIMRAAQAGADYIGYGPFRFTTTKKNLSPVLGIEGYRDASSFRKEHNLRIPLVAIGGITDADVPALIKAGADGIALSGSIVNTDNPTEATARIISIIHTTHIADI